MCKLWRALFCAVFVLTLLQTTNCGRFGGRSGGGGGRHSYPSSGGLSGSGSRRPGGLSGGNTHSSHTYPSSGNHNYPSGGLSGSGSSHNYPSGGSHNYPSGGLSGSGTAGKASYPSSGSGMSGGGQSHSYPSSKGNTPHTTVVNHNYHYTPPQQIRYSSPGQTQSYSYPVYHGQPPTYVYKYKDSGSKYGTLLAGLALLNLGTLGASVYAASKAGSSPTSHYSPQPGEYCKFGVKKENGDYEETGIDCNLITSFILRQQSSVPEQKAGTNSTSVTTITNTTTIVNSTNGEEAPQTTPPPQKVLYEMLPNGTLVPVNVTLPAAANTTENNSTAANGPVTSSVTITTTTTNTTVTNALDVKGEAIKVTPGMQCYIIRHTRPNNDMRTTVPCGLLQSYADQSIKKNAAARNIPTFTVLCAVFAFAFY